MVYELKVFGVKLIILMVTSPMAGFFFLRFIDEIEVAWKPNNRKRKWIYCSIIFMFFPVMLGWL